MEIAYLLLKLVSKSLTTRGLVTAGVLALVLILFREAAVSDGA